MMVEDDCYYNGTPSSCLDLKNDSALKIVSALAPNCDRGAWSPLSSAWKVFFYLEVSVYSLLYLMLGIVCILLLFKRHSAQRFKAKTFVAIDVALAILGFSRFMFYIIDPYGISGFCEGHIGCVVTSRLLYSLGFPSLTAAYTLVFITLWYSAKMRLGRNCIQHWKIIVPLCFIHYFVAIIVETIGAVGSYPVVFLLFSCEAIFTIWGLLVCITFLIAGCRLIHSIKHSVRQSSVVCRERTSVKEAGDNISSPGTSKDSILAKKRMSLKTSSSYSVTRMKLKNKTRHKQAIRKITIITYIAALLGGLYSLLTLVMLVMAGLSLFGPCPEIDSSEYASNSDVWLLLRYVNATIEYSMAILLVYSINDFKPIVVWIRGCFCLSSIDDENNEKQPKKYFYEETSESSTVSQFKNKLLLKMDTKTSIRFSEDSDTNTIKLAEHENKNNNSVISDVEEMKNTNGVSATK